MTADKKTFVKVVGTDGHEERLQRLESGSQEQAVRLESVATKQDYIAEQLVDARLDLANRLDSGFAKLTAFDERVTGTLEAHGKLMTTYDQRLKPLEARLEADVEAAKNRRALVKKIIVGTLLAAAGVFATKAGEIVMTWFQP
jgi:hypothetical protein